MTDYINEVISFLSCASSTLDDGHLCQEPLVLSCGHHICSKCSKCKSDYKSIKCHICNKINNRDLDQEQSTQIFDLLIKSNMKTLFGVIFDKFKRSLQTCKDLGTDNEVVIERQIQFVKDKIMIKIESVKVELDKLFEAYSKELDEIKENLKFEYKNLNANKIDFKEYENQFNNLQENIEKHENLTKSNLYLFENTIKSLQKTIADINSSKSMVEFNETEKQMSKELIGELVFRSVHSFTDENIIKNIEVNYHEKLKMEYEIVYADVLPNGSLLMSTDTNLYNLILYDTNMKYLKTVAKLNNKRIFAKAFATDENNSIFFANSSSHCIIKTDLEFNKLAKFGNGPGTAFDQLSYPIGICYYKDKVFVCDCNNKRVQVLDSNLVYQTSHAVNFNPWYMRNICNIAIVRASNTPTIYFFDLDTFCQLRKYDGHNGIIGVSKTRFYEYFSENKTFYVYSKTGELVNTIQTNGLSLSEKWNGSICCFNSKLLINCWNEKVLIFV